MESNQEKEIWSEPRIISLDFNNTEGGDYVLDRNEDETYHPES